MGCLGGPRGAWRPPLSGTPTAGPLRRVRMAPTPALTTWRGAAVLTHRCLSTEEQPDEETLWSRAMNAQYGVGSYQLFRPLYKDLCDEIRREYYTKPPPPLPIPAAAGSGDAATLPAQNTRDTTVPTAVPGSKDGAMNNDRAPPAAPRSQADEASTTISENAVTTPPSPEAVFGDGAWSVEYRPGDNVVVFRRAAVEEGRLAAVHAWGRLELKDPQRLNALLTFADWIPLEVCVERNGVLMHFSLASNEGGMHMRNVRVYAPRTGEEREALLDPSEDGECARKNLYYDGPCLWHLELDVQNELYDVMQDHGIDLDWVRWAASWVFYLEHVAYVRWTLGMLDELIPPALRGPEEDFLSPREKALLEEPVEDWLRSPAEG